MPLYQHENFGDVQKHVFRKGIITAVDSENDTADVAVPGGSNGTGMPLFYHCEPDSEERSNGAIEPAATAFTVDDEVIVMCEMDGTAVRIVGFVDGIKNCGQRFLFIWSAWRYYGAYYILWDVIHDKSVPSVDVLTDDGEETITFPYFAPFTLMDGLEGEVVVAAKDVEEFEDENDPEYYVNDLLYKWIMSREWYPDLEEGDNPALCPDPDHVGVPAWPTKDALIYYEMGPYVPLVTPIVAPSPTRCAPLVVIFGVN